MMDQLDIPQEENQDNTADNLFVPDINSNDAEERKLARRLRIQKREEAIARQQKAKEQDIPEKPSEKVTLLQVQLEKSSEILKELFQEAEQQVTNVRVANDSREVDRRELEGVGRERIFEHLREDAALSMRMFDEIAEKWGAVMQYGDPLAIHDELAAQKEKCDELIRQKDGVIAMLKHEVREAEAKFYQDQHSQNEDIRMLAKRVEKQVTIMRTAHIIELQNIEDVMIQERANMMENNDKRWNEMYKRREEQELSISENKLRQRQEFEEVVALVRIKHYEKIREVKISLERNCDQLQQEFEYVKACAMTNSEKMDYNYQILRKREGENIIIKSNQKRMLNKLQDSINRMRKKIKEYEAVASAQITKLCEEIQSLQKCIANEKSKSKTVSVSNDKRYGEVWELNRTHATKLLEKILMMDRLLCEQQLGIQWEEPHIKLQTKEKLPSYKAAVKAIEPTRHVKMKMRHHQPAMSRAMKKKMQEEKDDLETNIGYRRVLRHVLERIADKSGFLIEAKMKKIVANTSLYEGVLVKVDNVFDALGVNAVEDINIMLQFFRPYIHCPICSGEEIGPGGGDMKLDDDDGTWDMVSTNTSGTQVEIQGTVANLGEMTLPTITGLGMDTGSRDSNNALDQIVAAVVDPKRLKDSSSGLELITKEGECLGPTRAAFEIEKKVTQVVDYVTVIGDATSTSCILAHPLYMNPAAVLRALREFVTKVMCKSSLNPLPPPPPCGAAEAEATKITMTISRMMSAKEVTDYWERYKAILAARTSELWAALFYGLKKYHAILEDRHRLNEDLKCLAKQNAELRHLLKRFQQTKEPMRLPIGSVDPMGTKVLRPPCAVERESGEVFDFSVVTFCPRH